MKHVKTFGVKVKKFSITLFSLLIQGQRYVENAFAYYLGLHQSSITASVKNIDLVPEQ